MNQSHPGIEGLLEQGEAPTTTSEILDACIEEYRDGLELYPGVARHYVPKIAHFTELATEDNIQLWFEYLSLIALFAPLGIRKLLPIYEERIRRYNPGLLLWFKVSLQKSIDDRYGRPDR